VSRMERGDRVLTVKFEDNEVSLTNSFLITEPDTYISQCSI
jgi:hypothetical protein